MQPHSCYTQKYLSRNRWLTLFCFWTIPDHRQCWATSVQLDQIPSLSHILSIRKASFGIETYRSASYTTTETLHELVVLDESRTTSESDILVTGAWRPVSVWHATCNIGFCCSHPKYWVTAVSSCSYLAQIRKRIRLKARNTTATSYAASRGNRVMEHI